MLPPSLFLAVIANLCADQSAGWPTLLAVTAGQKGNILYPETETVFFITDRDLTFEFADGRRTVREGGTVVDEARKLEP